MKHKSDKEKIYSNSSTPRNKGEEGNITPISKIEDYQSSISNSSTRIETKNNNNNNNFINRKSKDNTNANKEKKKVKFNPLITVINIESFKKQNFEGNFSIEENSQDEFFKEEKEKKCYMCYIF